MQSAGLLPHRSVLDNIATVPRLNGVSKADARKRAVELLDVVGLAHSLGKRYPSQLSGGQQQRVGVARALAADPPVLLMDEPFSAVDPVVRDELQQELLRLQKDLAKTIVFVTHDSDEATILGDRVAVFATGGKLAQYATPEEILRAPANRFVASFVGRDRGFRHLGFSPSDGVVVHPVPTIVRADGGYESDTGAAGGWQLVVDADMRPLGWSAPGTERELVPGGSLFQPGDTLRRALDAALSSPSGLGVAVDSDGKVLGVIRGGEVLALIEEARQLRQAAL
ncbi:MAG: ATP-binding cassette domain-containing protein, partial [Actinomycetes bacterium]